MQVLTEAEKEAVICSERIKAARALVAAPMLITLRDIYSDLGKAELAERIAATLTQDLIAQQNITIKDPALGKLTMRLRMSKVPRNYRLETSVPHGFEGAMRKIFPIFVTAARSFWTEWCSFHPALHAELALPELNVSETAVWWSRDHPYWVGIVAIFADQSGHEYK